RSVCKPAHGTRQQCQSVQHPQLEEQVHTRSQECPDFQFFGACCEGSYCLSGCLTCDCGLRQTGGQAEWKARVYKSKSFFSIHLLFAGNFQADSILIHGIESGPSLVQASLIVAVTECLISLLSSTELSNGNALLLQ